MMDSFLRSSFVVTNSRCQLFIFSFSQSSNLFQLYHHGDPSNHCKDSPYVFDFSFLSIGHSFITGVLHGGSTWWFIKDLIPSRSVHWDSFQRSSSILHLAIQSAFFLSYYWRWYYAILDNLSSCFMIHMLSRMRYFKSINLFNWVILGYIPPKSFPKVCCYPWSL